MRKFTKLMLATALAATATAASADLNVRGFFANAALTVDALGVSDDGSGQLQATAASGSEVLAAYLYTSSVWSGPVSAVNFGGTQFNPASGATLVPDFNPATTVRYDVTSIVKPVIDGGAGGTYNFALRELGDNDGSVLVVVYKNALTTGGTAIILDGELATTGDTTILNFAGPFTTGDFVMSLASSFSYNGNLDGGTGQVTTVDIQTSSNPASRRLTSCAGGNDDGGFAAENGMLITAGGEGDSPANPNPACTLGGQDDELYNLSLGNSANSSPFITTGDTFLRLLTNNPSNNDNVFGLFITSTFSIDNPENPKVPEPSALALTGLGLLALAGLRRRRR